MKVTRVYSRYYDSGTGRYIVIVQVRRGTEYLDAVLAGATKRLSGQI